MNIEIVIAQAPAFCPVIECSECDDLSCHHNQSREKRIAAAQAEYEEALLNLKIKESALRAIIQNG